MSHHIEIFTGNCEICKEVVDIVTVGKCKDCIMDVVLVEGLDERGRQKMRDYDVTAVPTIVIDGKIKVVGIPKFPWLCGEEFYRFVEERYPLLINLNDKKK